MIIIVKILAAGFTVAILFELIYRFSGGINSPSYIQAIGALIGKAAYPLFYFLSMLADKIRCPLGYCSLGNVVKSLFVALSLSFNFGVIYFIWRKVSNNNGQ